MLYKWLTYSCLYIKNVWKRVYDLLLAERSAMDLIKGVFL